jgi:hypothetical protein
MAPVAEHKGYPVLMPEYKVNQNYKTARLGGFLLAITIA